MNRTQMFRLLTVAVAVFSVAICWQAEGSAGGKSSESKVKAKATSKAGADGQQTVSVMLTIDKGWHIYANPVGNENFETSRTRITVKAKDKVTANVEYPVGTVHGTGKEKYNVYENSVTIPIKVTRTMGDASPLQITIQVNACYEEKDGTGGLCLPPGKIELTVK
jgi:DsbC/DsbD-like thiol-disulfide interchange protein